MTMMLCTYNRAERTSNTNIPPFKMMVTLLRLTNRSVSDHCGTGHRYRDASICPYIKINRNLPRTLIMIDYGAR